MSPGTVISFPAYTAVEITGGWVASSTIVGAMGARADAADVGSFIYLVDVIEADGGRIGMWQGKDHAVAVREANFLAADFGCRVRDRVTKDDIDASPNK